uniref:Scol-LDLA n=1 Tax=Scolopendra viridis TaxID=118503 RepID=A0A4D5RA47_SCOVI
MNILNSSLFVLFCVCVCGAVERTQVQLFRCKGTEPFVCEGVHGLACVSPFSYCDGKPDCLDGEDERGCAPQEQRVSIRSFNTQNYQDYESRILPNFLMLQADFSDHHYNFLAAYLVTLVDFSTSSNDHVDDIIKYVTNSLGSYDKMIMSGSLDL